jgi:hypothetical protein
VSIALAGALYPDVVMCQHSLVCKSGELVNASGNTCMSGLHAHTARLPCQIEGLLHGVWSVHCLAGALYPDVVMSHHAFVCRGGELANQLVPVRLHRILMPARSTVATSKIADRGLVGALPASAR